MQIGMIGLGKMGANMVLRLQSAGHTAVVWDLRESALLEAVDNGAEAADSMDDLIERLETPRTVWLMIPAGAPTESTVRALGERLAADDVVIDGGNSHFKDDPPRARHLAERGVHYLDVGTSGGVWGRERGYCLMIGGEHEVVARLDPIFAALAPGRSDIAPTAERAGRGGTAELGYLHCGPAGAGHFVKMVHNGIEYGVMQSYAEGLDIMRSAREERVPVAQRYDLDVADIAELWRRGSVIGSWLLDLTAMALAGSPDLEEYPGPTSDSGEGRWTVATAIEQATPADVLAASLFARFRSRQENTFADRVLSAMRHKFGGHEEPPRE